MGNIFGGTSGNSASSKSSGKKRILTKPNKPVKGIEHKDSKHSPKKDFNLKTDEDEKALEKDDILMKSQDWKKYDDILEKRKLGRWSSHRSNHRF